MLESSGTLSKYVSAMFLKMDKFHELEIEISFFRLHGKIPDTIPDILIYRYRSWRIHGWADHNGCGA